MCSVRIIYIYRVNPTWEEVIRRMRRALQVQKSSLNVIYISY